jgi:phospholipid transport system substrate-binding protein
MIDSNNLSAGDRLVPALLLALLLTAACAASAPRLAFAADAVAAEPALNTVERIVAEGKTPHDTLERSTAALTDYVESARAWAKDDPDRYYREIEALLSPVIDFKLFARGVMATHYKRATPEQRERFRESFKWGLVKTYSLALTEFNDGKVAILPPDREPENPRRERVKMEITVPSGEVYPVVYQMRQSKSGKWRIINLVVNGVNMGFTFRSQFSSAMSDRRYGGDLDKVIEAWATVVEAGQDDAAG